MSKHSFEDGSVILYILVSKCKGYIKFGRTTYSAKTRASAYGATVDNNSRKLHFDVFHEWYDSFEKEAYTLRYMRKIAENVDGYSELFYTNPALEVFIHNLKASTISTGETFDYDPNFTLADAHKMIRIMSKQISMLEIKLHKFQDAYLGFSDEEEQFIQDELKKTEARLRSKLSADTDELDSE